MATYVTRGLTVCLLVLAAVAPGLGEEATAPGNPAAAVGTMVWQVPAYVAWPLPGLLSRGLLVVTQAPRGPADQELALIELDTGKVRWQLGPLPGGVLSANASQDTLLLELPGRVAGVSLQEGTVVWQQQIQIELEQGVGHRWIGNPVQSPGSETTGTAEHGLGRGLLVGGDRVYFRQGGVISALEAATGKAVWHVADNYRGLGGVLWLAGDSLLIPATRGLVALDTATGAERWTAPIPNCCWPFVRDGEVYALDMVVLESGHQRLFRVNPQSGEIMWDAQVPGRPHGVGGLEPYRLHAVGDRLLLQGAYDASLFDR